MRRNTWVWKIGTGFLAALCAVCLALPVSALVPDVFLDDGKMTLITEPGESEEPLLFYRNGEETPLDEMTWVDGGVHGQALRLDGQSEYLEVGYDELQIPQLTFVTWINWQGSVGGGETGEYWQRLLTMSRSEERYLTVSVHGWDAESGESGARVDGIYMEFVRDDTQVRAYNPVTEGGQTYALPQNEWHHVALVMDGQALKLYIDGSLWFSEDLWLGVADMQARQLQIGTGLWEDPLLNALLDDTALYNDALTEEQIRKLALGAASIDEEMPATQAPYLPTERTDDLALPTRQADETVTPYASSYLGLPVWGWYVLAGVLAVCAVAAVVVNVCEWRRRQ